MSGFCKHNNNTANMVHTYAYQIVIIVLLYIQLIIRRPLGSFYMLPSLALEELILEFVQTFKGPNSNVS